MQCQTEMRIVFQNCETHTHTQVELVLVLLGQTLVIFTLYYSIHYIRKRKLKIENSAEQQTMMV